MQKKLYEFLFPAITLICILPTVIFPQALAYGILPVALLASLCFAISTALNKSPALPLATVFFFLLVLVITRSASRSLLYMLLFLPVGAGVGLCYRKKRNLGDTALITLLAAAVGILLICVLYILEVSPIFSVKDALEPFRQMVSSVSDELYASLSLYAGAGMESVLAPLLTMTRESFSNTVFINLVYTAPILIFSAVLTLTGVVYFIMKRIFVRTKNETAFMSSFDTLRVSKTTAGIYMISIIFSAFLSLTSDASAVYLVVYILSSVLSYALTVCGFGLIWYYLKTKDFSKPVRMVLFVFIIFVTAVITILPSVLAFLAVMDSLLDLRSRIDGRFNP